jgi:hypothetical protein
VKLFIIAVALLMLAVANAQQKPVMSEQAFKNVPVDQFLATLGFFPRLWARPVPIAMTTPVSVEGARSRVSTKIEQTDRSYAGQQVRR